MKTTTTGIRLLGMSVALLAAGLFAGPKSANAATITVTGTGNGVGTSISYSGSGTSSVSATQDGTAALAYTTDWISFTVSPTSGGVATVAVNAVTPYPNSTWGIGTTTTNFSVTGPNPSNNTAVNVVLTSGTTYFLSTQSTAPSGTASQAIGIRVVDTPETTSTFTFLGVGLVGMLGLAALKGASQEA